MSVLNSKDRMFSLHELVLSCLEVRLQGEPTLKDIEAAMKFLKDNNVYVDLTSSSEDIRDKISVIPRLSDSELRLA